MGKNAFIVFCVLNMLLIVAVFEYVAANHRSVEALLLLPLLLLCCFLLALGVQK